MVTRLMALNAPTLLPVALVVTVPPPALWPVTVTV